MKTSAGYMYCVHNPFMIVRNNNKKDHIAEPSYVFNAIFSRCKTATCPVERVKINRDSMTLRAHMLLLLSVRGAGMVHGDVQLNNITKFSWQVNEVN